MIWRAFMLFCFIAFKHQILPTPTDNIQLEYNSAKSYGVYNIWILRVLKVPQTMQTAPRPPTHKQQLNNSQRILGAFTTAHK